MTIRLKVVRQKEERIKKVAELMNMYKVPSVSYPSYNYQPVGGSDMSSNWTTVTIDPRIQKTRELWQMFHIAR